MLERDVEAGPEKAIDQLLDGESQSLDGQEAAAFEAFQDRMARRGAQSAALAPIQAAWVLRMIMTPHSLRERMTLFWHNHFATSNAKVNNPGLMLRQNQLLRSQALGSFPEMLKAIARDPAMLLWLDAATSRKSRPNENYAREVMELFTLGRGHYTERDVQEAARAYSGSFIQGEVFREIAAQHDDGEKCILGQTGRFHGDDVARILLEQPACARFLCRKLYAHFVNELEPPPDDVIEPLAEAFRVSGYQNRTPVEIILRSRHFFDRSNLRKRVKSPIELLVGTVRALEITRPTVSAEALADQAARMGQALFAPPSVAGWDGGMRWINTTSMLGRTNYALALLSSDDEKLGRRLNPVALAERHDAKSPEAAAECFIDLLVQDGLEPALRERVVSAARAKASDAEAATREALTLVLSAPEFQQA
jgi:uncharacterized protein (DUF1800 family)